ncbi:MAG: RNA 2',3'-cyclic phosphodiesterase [Burkholderiaceae bacterium]|nr:RNA 2',3'-cyclic phosphodiesterase [Burkholderiaceae bacterium]
MPAAAATPAGTLRLFLALWPDGDAAAWLRACDAAIALPAGAAREGAARWHLTLHFLGAVPHAQLATLMPALEQPFAPLELELGAAATWPRGLVVVEPLNTAAGLHELHARLVSSLRRAGQRVETRPFRPHVTLARRAAGASWQALPPPQRWLVSSFALVASAGGHYRNVAFYPGGRFSGPTADPAPATAQNPPARRPTPR